MKYLSNSVSRYEVFLEVAEMRTHPVYTGRYKTTRMPLCLSDISRQSLIPSLQQLEPAPGPRDHPLPPPRLLQHQNLQRHRGAATPEAEVRMRMPS